MSEGINVNTATIEMAIEELKNAIKTIDEKSKVLSDYHARIPWDDPLGERCRQKIAGLALDSVEVQVKLEKTIDVLKQLLDAVNNMSGHFTN